MKAIEVSARKGGVGTTVATLAIARELAKSSPTLVIDTSHNADCYAVAGLASPSGTEVAEYSDNLHLVHGMRSLNDMNDYAFVVIDAGTATTRSDYSGLEPYRVGIVRNEYMSLRAETLYLNRPNSPKMDAYVTVVVDGGALNENDVRTVLNTAKAYHVFPVSPDVARSVDAGLFLMRDHGSDWARGVTAVTV